MTAHDLESTPTVLQCASHDDNRRAAPRRKVLKAGVIEFTGGAIPCTVRSLSASGAAIEINTPLWYPDRFVLAVDGERHPCRIVWRREKRLGLAFE